MKPIRSSFHILIFCSILVLVRIRSTFSVRVPNRIDNINVFLFLKITTVIPVLFRRWYREGATYPLDATITHAKTRSEPTVATLTLMPTREDDGAVFRCVVWNRAMSEGQQLDASVDLSVNCKYFYLIITLF